MAVLQRINIYDTDTTTIVGSNESALDVVFVPGLTNKYLDAKIDTSDPTITESNPSTTALDYSVWYNTADATKWVSTSGQSDILGKDAKYQAFGSYSYEDETIDLTQIAELPENPEVDKLTAFYTINDDVVTIQMWDDVDGTPTHVSEENDITVNLVLNSVAAEYCTVVGTYAWTYYDGTHIDVFQCTEAHTTVLGYWYTNTDSNGNELEYDYIGGQIIKYTSYSAFTKAVGSAPLCVYQYKVEGEDEAELSFKTPEDFAVEKDPTITGNKTAINKWIRDNLNSSDAIQITKVDKSWLYAAELLRLGLPVFYCILPFDGTPSADSVDFNAPFMNSNNILTEKAQLMYAELADKGEYDVKYITTGGFESDLSAIINQIVIDDDNNKDNRFIYPFYADDITIKSRKLVGYLADIANYRKDALVAVDSSSADCLKSLNPADSNSVYAKIKELVDTQELVNYWNDESYSSEEVARMGRREFNVFSWYKAICPSFPANLAQYRIDGNVFVMPGSFAYLVCLADSLTKYESASWEAIAGVTRAAIPNFAGLYVNERLSNAVADAYNPRNDVSINAITNIRPYGYCIWGNRTLVDNAYFATLGDGTDGLVASSFIDIMSMVCNINKVAYRACKRLMFEKDNDKLWVRFMQAVAPYMDQLISAGAIKNYEIQKQASTKRGQLVAKIIVWPYYAVEAVDVEIVLRDTETTTES